MIRIKMILDKIVSLGGATLCFVMLGLTLAAGTSIASEEAKTVNDETTVRLSIGELMNQPRFYLDKYVE